jgi:hypothetical protein
MPGQTAIVAQFPADDRLRSLAGNLDSGIHAFSGEAPKEFGGDWTGKLRELRPAPALLRAPQFRALPGQHKLYW